MAPEHDGDADQRTVFIDTSLDTHLATIVSDSDNVSDLKKKIMLEHHQCFPAIGDIKIHCLKVKRRGNFYHLSDSMLVKSAFQTTKRNWFVSVDASRLEQHDGIQQFDKRKVGDQLALPWVTDSRSIDRNDNLADRPLKLNLINGSPSMQPKIVPFVNQKVPSVDQFTSGDSCKDMSVNIEEHKSSNDDHWRNPQLDSEKQVDSKVETSNKEIKSKKRIRDDVHNGSSQEDALGSGPSVKKKRKTQKIDTNAKDSEENRAVRNDTETVKYEETGIPDENSFEHISKDKDATSDGLVSQKKINIINEGENHSAVDQEAIVVPLSVEDVGVKTHSSKDLEASETVADVAMVVEKDIQQETPFEISLKEQDDELVQKAVTGIEIPSSSLRTADSERDAPVVIAEGHLKGAKRSTKHKPAEKEVSSTSFTKELQKINNDAIDSSQQDIGSNGQEPASDQIDKRKEDRESSLNQGPEMKLPEKSKEAMVYENTGGGKKRKNKKSAKNKDETLVKHADIHVGDISESVQVLAPLVKHADVHVGDISESVQVLAPVFGDKIIDEREIDKFSLGSAERNEVSEKTLVDDLTGKEVEISEPTESHGRQVHIEDSVVSRRKKKVARKAASINDDFIAKDTGDAATGTNDGNALLHSSETKENPEMISVDGLNNAVEISRTEKNINQVNAEDINDNSKKESEKMDGTKKSKKKKKTKTSAARNEDIGGMSKAVSDSALGGLNETAKEGESSLPDSDRKDNPNEKLADASQLAVGTDGDKDGMGGKSRNKQNSTSQTLSSVPIEDQLNKIDKAQDGQVSDDGLRLVKKAKKNHKSSVKARKDKHQSTEFEQEPKKSKVIPEETLKNVGESEVSKVRIEGRDDVNNEVNIPKERSQEIDFMNYFVPGHGLNKTSSIENVKDATQSGKEKKPKKKTKGLQKVSTNVVKDPNITNINQIKTPKKPRIVDTPKTSKSAHINKGQDGPLSESSSSSETFGTFGRSVHNQKSNKQQSIQGQSHVKSSKKGAPLLNDSKHVKGLLNTPATIFGDDSDGNSENSDSSTRTPSRMSSSSGESASSIEFRRNGSRAVKRKESGGKNIMNSQSRMKNITMADIFRSSNRFKKAKMNASQQVEDTESEPVEFVPDSQPIGKR